MNGFQKFILKLCTFLYPVKYIGVDNIPKGGAILVSNHLSVIDCVYLRKMYSNEMYLLAKKELFKSKLVAKILKSFGAIPVDRQKPALSTLLTAASVLRRDCKLLIFPEGTRNKTGTTQLQQIKDGSAVLAVKTKKPIVPIMIYKKAKLFRRNYVMIGKSFEFSEYYETKMQGDEIKKMDSIVRERMVEEQRKLFELLQVKKEKRVNAGSDR